MAGTMVPLYRNYDAEDNTNDTSQISNHPLLDPASLGWAKPDYVFSEWNSQRDGSGTGYAIGDEAPEHELYAQWAEPSYPAGYLDGAGLHRVWGKVKALIPTTTSQLTNDSGYITLNDLPIWDGGVT